MKKYIPLWAILIVVMIKGLIWISVIPPLQNPDEPAHLEYIQYIGETGTIPIQTDELTLSHEITIFANSVHLNDIARNPDAKYQLDEEIYNLLHEKRHDYKIRESTGSHFASGYPPGYYFLAALVYKAFYFQDIFVRFYAIRILSLILSLVAVTLAYLIGKKMEPNSKLLASVLAITTGMHPMFSMTSASVNNDVFMEVMSVGTFLWILHAIQRTDRNMMILGGVLVGVGLLIKPQMVFINGMLLLILLVVYCKKYSLKMVFRNALYVAVPAIVVYLPWALFSFTQYHSLTGGTGPQPVGELPSEASWYLTNGIFDVERMLGLWVKMYWANFGWLDTNFPSQSLYFSLAAIMVVGLIGAVYGVINKMENYKIVSMSLIFSLGNIAFLYLVEFLYFKEFHNTMLQGRYLLTALVPINIVIIYGFRYIFPARFKNFVYYSFAVGMIFFNICSIDLIFSRYHG